jgi:hypothetical protein
MHELNAHRMTFVHQLRESVEIGDAYAMAAWAAVFLGAYEDGLRAAEAGVEFSRGVSPGTFLHCLTFVVLARFALGDWDGALRAHGEMVEVNSEDPRELPPGPYVRAYAGAALCHELRGEPDEAERCLDLVLGAVRNGMLRPGLVGACGAAARTLVHRDRVDEALELFPWTSRGEGSPPLLEALCEVAAAWGDWGYAGQLLELARTEAAECDLLALPHHADRLEGRIAAASGRTAEAAEALRRSAEGFARLKAPWEEAYSRLLEAELAGDTNRLPEALATFEHLKSVKEAARARQLLSGAEASHP